MKYKIGDVARILGISPDLLRYYEKKGVVTPEKNRSNDYRYYDSWDINYLMDCLWFKNFGFSIEQIAEMAKIPRTEDISSLFEGKEEELRDTIRRCQLLLLRSEEHRQSLSRARELLHHCELCTSPEMVRYINRTGNEYITDPAYESSAKRWLGATPFNRRYFEMSSDALLPGNESDYGWGYCINMNYVELLGFLPAPPDVHMSPRKSVHTVFKSNGKGGFAPALLSYAVDYAAEQGLKVVGPIHGVLLASIMENGEQTGYFEAWLPVE